MDKRTTTKKQEWLERGRNATKKQVWVDRDLCEQVYVTSIPDTEDVPDQLTWKLHYWLRRGLETATKKPRRP